MNQPIFQAPVAHAITSILWLIAFLTSASSTCAATISQGGSCAAAILRDLATAGPRSTALMKIAIWPSPGRPAGDCAFF